MSEDRSWQEIYADMDWDASEGDYPEIEEEMAEPEEDCSDDLD